MTKIDLTPAQKSFLAKRGDKLTKDHIAAHDKALAAKLKVDSPRYFRSITDHLDSLGGSRKAAAEQPKPSKPRFDGASAPMPKLRGGGDEFHALRSKASSAYRKKS